ncbi:DUF2252 domain-containing protein [Streptomyces antarcticus]|uniref:DUF2252 domain-containing protein n=1 Tax=Streptomyces antarcticus TaxID=2996458 RepID=UPI003B82FB5B
MEVIEGQSATRVQELVPIRYGRMAESPFRFYRGAAAITAGGLAVAPDSGIRVQLCGDAHLLNFRLLGPSWRNLLFDINDFDETLPGPWEWDVKRLATSLVIAGRENGFSDRERAEIVRSAVRAYREQMRAFAGMGNLDVWYARVDEAQFQALAEGALHTRGRKNVSEALHKARGRDSRQAFEKITEVVGGHRRFAAVPQLITPVSQLMPDQERNALDGQIRSLVERYGRSLQTDRRHLLRQYTVVDMARKVVGVGSVGMRCRVVLLFGRDGQDPLILRAKEASDSVLAAHAGASAYATQGVVAGQRLMQAASDIFLGCQRSNGIDGLERDFRNGPATPGKRRARSTHETRAAIGGGTPRGRPAHQCRLPPALAPCRLRPSPAPGAPPGPALDGPPGPAEVAPRRTEHAAWPRWHTPPGQRWHAPRRLRPTGPRGARFRVTPPLGAGRVPAGVPEHLRRPVMFRS